MLRASVYVFALGFVACSAGCIVESRDTPTRETPVGADDTPADRTKLVGTTTTSAPIARAQHSAIWTGKHMLIWGGYNDAGALSRGASYEPTTGTWSRIDLNGPAPRYGHAAIWTSKEMLIWGGLTLASKDSSVPTLTNLGARYLPQLDRWQSLNSEQAPSPRADAVSAWTGTAMLIWGGRSDGAALNDGKAYDPIANTWTAISTTNAPTASAYQRGVWTGTELVVIGGGVHSPASSGVFNPQSPPEQAWRAINPEGMPDDQCDFTLVWTGQKVLLWGGTQCSDPSKLVGTGAAYELSTNSWSPMTETTARTAHTAVWTGEYMLTWGGVTATGPAASGRLFEPIKNAWTPANSEANDHRKMHSAVWTGKAALVWGGTDQYNDFLSSGNAIEILPLPKDKKAAE